MARPRMSRQELTLATQRENLKALLDNPAFVKFIFTIFTEAGIFYPTYSRRSPHDTSHAEGRRALGLEVLHMLKMVRPDILALVERAGNLLEADLAAMTPKDEDDEYAPLSIPDDDDQPPGAAGSQ